MSTTTTRSGCCDPCTSIEIPGPQGPTGPQGPAGTNGTNGTNGVNAYTTASSFVMPVEGGSVTVAVGNSTWMVVGQIIYVAGGSARGYFEVASKPTSTSVILTNLEDSTEQRYTSNSPPATVFPNLSGVSPGGEEGPGNLAITITENRASLKALPSTASRQLVFLKNPEDGVPKSFLYSFTATDTPDDISIIEPDDGIGRYFQYNLI